MTWTWDPSVSTDVALYIVQVAIAGLSFVDVGATPDLSMVYDPPTPLVGEVVFVNVEAEDFAGNRSVSHDGD